MSPPASTEKTQFFLLTRHFFNRFFRTNLVNSAAQMDLTVIHILSVLSIPGLLFSLWIYPDHAYLVTHFPLWVETERALRDKAFFVVFSMLIMGFLTVLEWDALFPDRQDYSILIPLPIQSGTLFAAKFAALVLFLLLFSLAINGFSSLIFPLAVNGAMGALLHGDWYPIAETELAEVQRRSSLLHAGRFALSHAFTMVAGNAFMLFLCASIQGLFLKLLSHRLFQWVSRALQFLLLVFLLVTLFLLPVIISSFETLMWHYEYFKYLFPPFWFLGLYEVLLGTNDPVLRLLAAIALNALIFAVVAFVFTCVIGYRRQISKTLEASWNLQKRIREYSLMTRFLHRLVLKDPVELACFHFIAKTVLRSQKHKLILGAYVGAGLALVVVALVALFSNGDWRVVDEPSAALLSIPLILSFFILVGLRVIFTIPAELEANWIFRLTDTDSPTKAISAVRKAVLLLGILPVLFSVIPLFCFLWDWRIGLLHLAYVATLSFVLREILLLGFQKIPFTCSYVPGRANIKLFWFAYLISFTTYAYSMSSLEHWLMKSPFRFFYFYSIMGFLLVGWQVYKNRLTGGEVRLVYDEEPEPAVRTLDLSS